MQTEIEAKFLNIDHDKARMQLKKLGAKCKQPVRNMRRTNYDYPDLRLQKRSGWIRLRDEGNKITLAYKQLNDRSLHGTKEVSIIVDSFEQTGAFLKSIGLEPKSYQETKRESWDYNGVDIELDEWPWIPKFLEIEARSESEIKKIAQDLELDWGSAIHGSVENAYEAVYNVSEEEIDSLAEIAFGPVPDWLEKRRKK